MRKRVLAALLLAFLPLLLQIAVARGEPAQYFAARVTFIDVGQGEAILVQDGAGFDALIDGGPEAAGERVLAHLRRHARGPLEVMLASHADSDHVGGLIAVLEAGEPAVNSVLYNGYPGDTQTWQRFAAAIDEEGLALAPLQYPATLSWGSLEVLVLNPPAGLAEPESNAASAALRLASGEVEFLLTADIDSGVEAGLLALGAPLAAEVLKVAHHGSRTGSGAAFLQAVQPREAVISVGPNSYGHPAPEILRRLSEYGACIWRTDFLGSVVITVGETGEYAVQPATTYLPFVRQAP